MRGFSCHGYAVPERLQSLPCSRNGQIYEMKRLLIVLGVIFIVLVVAVAALIGYAALTGSALDKRSNFHYPVSRGFCEGAAAVRANFRFRISIKLRM